MSRDDLTYRDEGAAHNCSLASTTYPDADHERHICERLKENVVELAEWVVAEKHTDADYLAWALRL
jgi:hypothetical protein